MFIWHRAVDLGALNALGDACMHGHIGLEFVDVGDDWLAARMPVDERTRQPHGILHGGASVVLAESTASVAGSLTIDPAVSRVAGLEINANHIRPVKAGFVRAVATADAIGRSTQVWSIRITDDADRLVCTSRLTLAIITLAEPAR